MSIVSLPPLQYPYDTDGEPLRHPLEAQTEEETSNWIDHEYLFLTDTQRTFYKQCRFGMISSCFYPQATSKALTIGARLVLLLFIHDDYTDNIDIYQLRPYLLKSEAIMAGQDVPCQRGDLLYQFKLFRDALLPLAPAAWMQRWCCNLNYFYEGMIMERCFTPDHYPSVPHYMFLREHLIGIYIYQDIVELYMSSFMPYALLSHPHVRELRRHAALIISWCHDYYSAKRELAAGQMMNLVLVIRQAYQCSLEDAYAEAARIHIETVKTFLQLKENPPDFGPYNGLFREYAGHLLHMCKGNHLWHLHSGRYDQ
ncbi:hypothetical protein HF329_03740 [Chitinophaga oryzae]|uniref:Terpene synthase n=1 Tax=Chitinophaga oryzae TaxID=2725414 RepID=A0AAE6ZD26_9BACT|nr:terpene synthase family protein [Chitinophaga oryzae]QJB30459.1 hypothetical protein HF329_03740 [Chitinophaga oryzae]